MNAVKKQNKNVYKPRYKIAYQAKSKIWPYKNSRLRGFFKLRSKKSIRRGKFKRYVLVFNNMKWTIARRNIRPYMFRSNAGKRRYKDIFYKKQQIRNFYGKVSEETFRNFFKRFLANSTRRNKTFFTALEFRLDMVLFRMKIMPTIYACNQLIHHHGVFLNKKLKNSPQEIVRVGDLISLPKNQWNSIFFYIFTRIYFRGFGYMVLKKRRIRKYKKMYYFSKKIQKPKIDAIKVYMVLRKILFLFKNFESEWLEYFKNTYNDVLKISNNVIFDAKSENLKYEHLKQLLLLKKRFKKFVTLFNRNKNFCIKKDIKKDWYSNKKYKFAKAMKLKLRKKKISYKKKFNIKLKLKRKKTLKILKLIYLFYKKSSFFIYQLKNFELNFLKSISQFPNEKTFEILENNNLSIWNYLNLKQELLKKKYMLLEVKKSFIFKYKFFKKEVWQEKSKYYTFKRYMDNIRKLKTKKRTFMTPRLKPIHMFIPSYIYFDYNTLRGVILYAPKPNEIYYPFRASLTEIYSYYKSRGY